MYQTNKQKKNERRTQYQLAEEQLLGNKTQFEVLCKTASALYDFINGVKQAANIQNAALSQKAKDGMNYLQNLDALFQQIKALKQSMDDDLVVIDAQPEDVPPVGDNNG